VQPSTAPPPTSAWSLSTLLAVARRRRWMIIAATLAAGVAGYTVASDGAPEYEARAVLLTGSLSSDDHVLQAAGQLAQTYAQLATTRPVLDGVSRRLRVGPLDGVVDASASPVTRLLTIRARYRDPRTAAAIANAEAAQLVTLAAQRGGSGALSSSGRLRIVDPAAAQAKPTGPSPGVIAALAAIIGGLTALALATVLDRSARSVRSAQELEALTGVPCVASLSRAAVKRSSAGVPVVASSPRSRAADEYRVLASKLSVSGRQSVLVTAVDGDSTVIARNLAAALAAGGAKVAVIAVDPGESAPAPADGRRGAPTVKAKGRLERSGPRPMNGSSLPTAANGTASGNGVAVLPPGVVQQARLAGPDGVRDLVERAEAEADVVVLYAPSLHYMPDGLTWARAADGTLLLVQRDRTDTRRVRDAAATLSLVRAQLCGTVLVEPPPALR
jgi:capsular polysaccharide biosynthesis protein